VSDFAIAGLCLLCWLNGVVFGWAFWELPRLKKRKHDPVAWTDIDFKDIYISEIVAKEKNAVVPLYTPSPLQRTWAGLTDEEISAIDWKQNETLHDFARAIEAKLKQKNGYAEEKNI